MWARDWYDNDDPPVPCIWCDVCGWGFTIIGNADGEIHFCHRHNADEVRQFWTGERPGYFDLENEENEI